MYSETKISVKNSIAARMLLVVLGLYMIIAACVTASHVWMEYNNQKSNIIKGLGDIESAFNKGLAVSLWGLDQESLTASVKGMLKIPTLVGVKIISDEGGMVAIGGIVAEHGETGNAGLHVNLAGLTDTEKAVHKGESHNLEMFERQFPIVYELDGKNTLLGRAIIYSSSSVIYQRMKLQIIMLVINVALTLITFSLALWWAINRYLHRPLVTLASSAEKVTLENLDSFRVNIETSGRNELKVLEESFNAMIGNLNQSMAQRKQAEQALQSSQAFLDSILENIPNMIFVKDAGELRFVMFNRAGEELLGIPRDELIGKNDYDFFPLHEADFFTSRDREVLTGGSILDIPEEPIKTRKGTRLLHTRKIVILDPVGTPKYLVGISEDITDQKRSDEERLSLERQLLHAQKLESLGVLAGGIAHDFNNILTAIIGNTDLAMMRLNPESPVLENLQRIEAAAVRAADLAKQMLAYSGKGKFVVEHIDLNRLVEEMGHMLEVSISKKAVLRYNLTKSLPAINADATQIRQIIMNLVINASEAIGDQSGVIAISTGCLECNEAYLQEFWLTDKIPEGLYVSLEVADTGCGMDKETLGKIFDPFFTTKFTGRGLGMAAMLGIVRGHKGAVKVYSEPGKGSSFKVLLPAGSKPAELFNNETMDDNWRGCGVALLVDDEETIRALGGEMLRELGFEVITATDGCDAVAKYTTRNDICLVILDLTMPHMDGEQCFRELRQLNPKVKVIMSSGFSEQEVTQKFAGKGLAGFVQKPYKLSTLRQAIKNIDN
jgi:PAS domain S-box-containing protein